MKIFDKTSTVKKDGKTYTNDITRCRIYCDEEELTHYCVLAVDGVTVTIKEGNMITQVGLNDIAIKDVIQLFMIPPEKKQTKKEVKSEKKSEQKNGGKK